MAIKFFAFCKTNFARCNYRFAAFRKLRFTDAEQSIKKYSNVFGEVDEVSFGSVLSANAHFQRGRNLVKMIDHCIGL